LSQPSEDSEYVIPSFAAEEEWRREAPPLLVIAAPGAVGKSSLARHLAADRATALWDLSKLSIGTGTFAGVLAQSFGAAALPNVLADLGVGRALFVFDALDEAEVRSTWPRVADFLEEVFHACQSAPHIVAVILARTDTAMRIDALFEQLAAGAQKHAVLQLSFFDRDGAFKFVRKRLEARHGRKDVYTHQEPFQRALSSVFEQLEAAVRQESGDSTSAADAFVGYAPVLDAVASLLSEVTNWTQADAHIRDALAQPSGRGLLYGIIWSLLEREHAKFQNACHEALSRRGLDGAAIAALYTPYEQLQRLSVYTLYRDLALTVSDLPGDATAIVKEQVATMLPNHPFLNGESFAGPAFRDFVLAAALLDDSHEQFAEELLGNGSFVPSPLLLRFYAATGAGNGKATHAGFLHESGIAASAIGDAEFSIGVADDSTTPSSVSLTVDCQSAVPPLQVSMSLTHSEAMPLTFRRRLAGASIAVSGRVVLGDGSSFHVQDSDLDCDTLEIKAKELVVLAGPGGRRSELSARSLVHTTTPFSLKATPTSALALDWPEANRHPWLNHRDQKLGQQTYDRDGAFFALHRVLKWFRRHKRSEYAKYRKFIDNVIGGRGGGHEIRREMIEYLLAEGHLQVNEPFYTIDPQRLEDVGVTWASLQSGNRQPSADGFLDAFLKKRENRRTTQR
jgi:hypothetical protein